MIFRNLLNFLDKYSLKIVIVVSTFVGIGTLVVVYLANLTVIYADAASHLNIARRVFDNLTPGIVQLGGTWAPLQHILMLPFIWNDFMWHSGLAGAIISTLSFIGMTYYIFKLVEIFTNNRVAALIGSLVIIINPNALYLQAIPMGETLGLFLSVASVYYLARWAKTKSIVNLITSAAFICAASLSRYETWSILLAEFIFVIIVAYKTKGYKGSEGMGLVFACLAGLGPFVWFIWGLLIFGDPLYFLHNQYSADIQGKMFNVESSNSFFIAKGNLLQSIKYYMLAVGAVNGYVLSVVAFLVVLVVFLKEKINTIALLFSVLASVVIFEIFSLYNGSTTILLPQLPPYHILSVRYGIWALPLVAALIGYLFARKNIIVKIGIIISIISQLVLSSSSMPITLAEPISSMRASNYSVKVFGQAIRSNCEGSLVLISVSVYEPVVFFSGMPIKNFIYEGSGEYWRESLKNPTKYAECIVMTENNQSPLDKVAGELLGSVVINKNYTQVYSLDSVSIYKKIGHEK